MPLKPLHVGPGSSAILRWLGPFPANTDRIDTPWRQGQEGFEADGVELRQSRVTPHQEAASDQGIDP
jgi:hypothetical protein